MMLGAMAGSRWPRVPGGLLRTLRAGAALALCGVLAACVTPRAITGNGSAGEFSRVGRFALTVTEAGGGQNAVQGGFSWFDDGRRYVLDLTNPLGSTEARVEGVPGQARLTRSDRSTLDATDPDALTEDALGSRVPVAGMRDWLRGRLPARPAPDGHTLDDQTRPVAFEQGGWRARLSRYDALGPQLLVLERTEPGRRIVLRLVVNPS
jgi:outer membrane lipoprotein LolB